MGLVMWLGIGCIYLAAVAVLRPLLLWQLRREREAARASAPNPEVVPAIGSGDRGR